MMEELYKEIWKRLNLTRDTLSRGGLCISSCTGFHIWSCSGFCCNDIIDDNIDDNDNDTGFCCKQLLKSTLHVCPDDPRRYCEVISSHRFFKRFKIRCQQ